MNIATVYRRVRSAAAAAEYTEALRHLTGSLAKVPHPFPYLVRQGNAARNAFISKVAAESGGDVGGCPRT